MKEKLSENYRIGNVTLNLSWTKCDMVIVVNNVVVGNRFFGASTSNYTDNGTSTSAAGNDVD